MTGLTETIPVVWYSTDPASGATTWKERPTNMGFRSSFVCVSAKFCIGPESSSTHPSVESSTNPAGMNTWTSTLIKTPVPGFPITTVGCASASLCVADDGRGDLYTGRPRG